MHIRRIVLGIRIISRTEVVGGGVLGSVLGVMVLGVGWVLDWDGN